MIRLRPRRGVALLAALWLVVIIATVSLQFSLTARERRELGLLAADRARDRAALTGALATTIAHMDRDLRTRGLQGGASTLRSSDPWLDVDSLYAAPVRVGDATVRVQATDLGATVNINTLDELELQQLFGFVLGDYDRATAIAQSIMDWRDADVLPRPRGGEAAEYLRDGRFVLPANAPFRTVDDLVHVAGITPDVLERVRPYMNAHPFPSRVNLNAAPEAVLRTIPGITDAVVGSILAMRSAGRRIESVGAVLAAAQRNTGGSGAFSAIALQLADRATVDTRDVQLRLIADDTLSAHPMQLLAVVQRADPGAVVLRWRQW